MGCGCAEKERDRRKDAWQVFNIKQAKEQIKWHIVILSAHKTPDTSIPLIKAIGALAKEFPEDITWTLVSTDEDYSPAYIRMVREHFKGDVVALPDETNVPRAFNVGAARVRQSKYTILLHDDVGVPEGCEWLEAMAVALERAAGAVVPHFTGECANPSQASDHYGVITHTSEYISSAAIAFHTQDLIGQGLNDKMVGYDWWQTEWQVRMAYQGRAVLVAPCTLHHVGGATYGVSVKDRPELQTKFLANMNAMHESVGWPLDFKMRPRYPRAHLSRKDRERGKALSVIIGSADEVETAWKMAEAGGYDQLAVVDAAHLPDIDEALDKCDRSRVYYVASYDENIYRQAVNAPDYDDVCVVDLRVGAGQRTMKGHRVRAGLHYMLPAQMTEINIGMLAHFGIGDTLLVTPAIHAFRQAFPWVKIVVHHAWAAADLLRNNPDIDEIYVYSTDKYTPPTDVVDVFPGNGSEDNVWSSFRALGLPVPERTDIQYVMTPDEREEAVKWLEARGVDTARDVRIVGIQKDGGWEIKGNWMHHAATISELQAQGYTILEFGGKAEDPPVAGVIQVAQVPLRTLAALISLLDRLICFDTGIGWLAGAFGTPCCSLWGPHEPARQMAIVGTNSVCIRKRTPAMCKSERGYSCRETNGGSRCPYRPEGTRGGDCLDSITTDEVLDALNGTPMWNQPVRDRHSSTTGSALSPLAP